MANFLSELKCNLYSEGGYKVIETPEPYNKSPCLNKFSLGFWYYYILRLKCTSFSLSKSSWFETTFCEIKDVRLIPIVILPKMKLTKQFF